MPYPSSSDVTAGQPTAYQHYNNLRADALRFGQAAVDSVNLGTLLSKFSQNLNIEILSTNRLRIVASASAPVSLMVNGYLLQATANVDLSAGGAPSGSAATWYIFANRTAGSITFTLSVNTSSTEGTDQRRIGRFYWDGSQIEPESIRIEDYSYWQDVLNLIDPLVCEGRLTLTSATPVTTSDVTSGTLYFTPYNGSRIALYVNDYGWKMYTFSEINISLSGKTANTNYDVFIYDSAGTLTLELTAWASATSRATALVLQNGVYVKSGAITRRYLGTVRMSATATAADTLTQRFVWNCCNRLPRPFYKADTTDNWSYLTSAWRSWNNSASNQVEAVFGLDEGFVDLLFLATMKATARGGAVGIGIDSTTTNSAFSTWSYGTNETPIQAQYHGNPGLGYHSFAMLETCVGASPSITFYGDGGFSGNLISHLAGWLMG